MPTVKLPNGTKRTFPYNAVGKAQADSFSKMMGGKKKNIIPPEFKTPSRVQRKSVRPHGKPMTSGRSITEKDCPPTTLTF